MNTIKYNPFGKNRPVNIDQFFDQFSSKSLADFFNADFVSETPSVNISEEDGAYSIEVAAPGLAKEDFSIDLDNDHLVISGKKSAATEEGTKEGSFRRREFNYGVFTRRFHLSDDISRDDIQAKYNKGILTVSLTKREEAKDYKRTIVVD